MHTPGLKARLEGYLKRNPGVWLNGGELERLALSIGYKASNASRRCRELAETGILERKEEKGSVWYRAPIKQPNQMSLA